MGVLQVITGDWWGHEGKGGGMFPPVVGKETKWVYEALKSRRWMKCPQSLFEGKQLEDLVQRFVLKS